MWKLQSKLTNGSMREREGGGGRGTGGEGERESEQTKQAATTAKVVICSEAVFLSSVWKNVGMRMTCNRCDVMNIL